MVRCTPNSGPSSLERPLYAVSCRLFPITDVNRPNPKCNELTHNGSQRLSVNTLFQFLQTTFASFRSVVSKPSVSQS